MGERFFEDYRRTLDSDPALEAAVSRYGIRWAIFPYAGNPALLGRFSRNPHWRLAYADHLAALFVRSDPGSEALVDPAPTASSRDPLASDPGDPGPRSPGLAPSEPLGVDRGATDPRAPHLAPSGPPGADRSSIDPPALEAQPFEPEHALPGLGGAARRSRWSRFWRGVVMRERFPAWALHRGIFHLYRNELSEAEQLFRRAIAESGGDYYEIYNNLGAVLYRQKRLDEAAACYRIVLEDDPGNKLALDRLSEIARTGRGIRVDPW
jgi:tetratricopeptide (TPR) repeat protein